MKVLRVVFVLSVVASCSNEAPLADVSMAVGPSLCSLQALAQKTLTLRCKRRFAPWGTPKRAAHNLDLGHRDYTVYRGRSQGVAQLEVANVDDRTFVPGIAADLLDNLIEEGFFEGETVSTIKASRVHMVVYQCARGAGLECGDKIYTPAEEGGEINQTLAERAERHLTSYIDDVLTTVRRECNAHGRTLNINGQRNVVRHRCKEFNGTNVQISQCSVDDEGWLSADAFEEQE